MVCALGVVVEAKTFTPVVIGPADWSCIEVYENKPATVVPEEAAVVPAKPGGGPSTTNSKSRDLVTTGEAGMEMTGLVSNNGLLVNIAWLGVTAMF
ncbi:hypothetical protein Hanom_Chr00s000003g01603901 [Helianthus anomalus]